MREGRSGMYSIEAVWLVKAGDRILGPFTVNEIAGKLRSKEIVLIDEVTLPMSRWRVIRDEAAFASVVEEIRKGQMAAREDTEIQGNTLGNHTLSTDEFSVAIDPHTNIPEVIGQTYDSSRVRDAEFTETPNVPVDKPKAFNFKRAATLPQYGIGTGTGDPTRSSRLSTAAWVITAAALVISLFVYVRGQTPGTKEPASVGGQNLNTVMSDADAAWRQGDFVAALNWYRVAGRIKPKNPEIVSRMAPLMITLEGQTVQAKRALTEVLSLLPPSGESGLRGEVENGIGLAALASDDLSEADARFRAALAVVPTSFAAQFNSGMTAYLMKSYAEAARRFAAVGDEPAALLMTARSNLAAGAIAKTARSTEAVSALEKLIERHQDYRQEALVVSAFVDLQNGNKRAALLRVNAALDVDPDLTNDHWHDPALYLEPLSWRSLIPFCRSLNEEFKTASTRGLFSLCLFKGGKREEANETLNDALSRNPDDGSLRSVAAYMLAGSERTEEAKAALALAIKSAAPRLATILKGRLCEQAGDDACADAAWKSIISQGPPSVLSSLTGLAKLRLKTGDRIQAQAYLDQAKVLSPRYKPALMLKIDGAPK